SRTLESRYILNKYETLSKEKDRYLTMNRNLLRRGKSPMISRNKKRELLSKKYNSYEYKKTLKNKTNIKNTENNSENKSENKSENNSIIKIIKKSKNNKNKNKKCKIE